MAAKSKKARDSATWDAALDVFLTPEADLFSDVDSVATDSDTASALSTKAQERARKTARNKKRKEAKKLAKQRKARDSLDSVASAASFESDADRDESRLKDGGWGMKAIKPTRFEEALTAFVQEKPRPVEMLVGSREGYLGLAFIDFATSSGSRSLLSWMESVFEREMVVKHGAAFSTRPPREVHELRFLVFVLDLALQDATFVKRTLSGASVVLDVLARRLFASYQVLAGEMSWSVAERSLPVGAVKRDPGVQSSKLFGMAKELKRGEKVKAVLRGESVKTSPAKPKGSG